MIRVAQCDCQELEQRIINDLSTRNGSYCFVEVLFDGTRVEMEFESVEFGYFGEADDSFKWSNWTWLKELDLRLPDE